MEASNFRSVLLKVVFVLLLATTHTQVSAATKHAVGGSQGWDESTDFDSWASAQTFKVGDTLEFKYTAGLHSVAELGDESAFKSCDIGSAVNSLNGGSNTVKLDKPGTRYFACGTSGHCQQGMKVKITTVAADGSSPASTTTTPAAGAHSTSAGTSHHKLHLLISCVFALIGSLVLLLALF